MDAAPRLRATRLGATAVLVAVVGFSLINVIVKIAQIPAITFALWRLWLGALAMIVVVAVTGRRITWEKVKRSAPAGALFGLNVTLFFMALKATAIADVLVIAALQPALTMLVAGPLFGERVGRHDVAWMGVSLVGVALVTIGQSGTPAWSLKGDLLAAAALVVWTVYFLISKRVRTRVAAVEYMAIVTFFAALVITPWALLSGEPLGGLRWQDLAWLGLFLVGAQGGHVLLAWAHAQVDVSVSTLLILAEPVVAAVAALMFLGEPIAPLAVGGGALVVCAVAAIVRRATRAGQAEEIRPPEP